MKYLQLGVAAEGTTDFAFYGRLLPRICEDILRRESTDYYEISQPLEILPQGKSQNTPELVVEQVISDAYGLDILFYHSDAGGNVELAERSRLRPVIDGLMGLPVKVVGVIPKHETETWALVDAEAVARVGSRGVRAVADQIAGAGNDLESIDDPKRLLATLVAGTSRRRRPPHLAEVLTRIADLLDLQHLERLPQYNRLKSDLRSALAIDY